MAGICGGQGSASGGNQTEPGLRAGSDTASIAGTRKGSVNPLLIWR